MYIELLEKISEAFDKIPSYVKKKYIGYDTKTFAKLNQLKFKLKSTLKSKTNSLSKTVHKSSESNPKNNNIGIISSPNSASLQEDNNNSETFDFQHCEIFEKSPGLNRHNSSDSSLLDLPNLSRNGPSKTIYSDIHGKTLQSTYASSPLNDSVISINQSVEKSDNYNSKKGKFVFKRPSKAFEDGITPIRDVPSSTIERLKNASEKLKPVPTNPEIVKVVPIENSSERFQPPQFSRNSFLDKPCTSVLPVTSNDEEDEYRVPLDFDDDIDMNNQSVVNVSGTSNIEKVNDKEFVLDEDGWPEYRVEDFEDDFKDATQSKELNLMEDTILHDNKPKYEGMGDFHAGTQNDGITGKFVDCL